MEDKYFVTFVGREATKHFNVKTEGKEICQNIRSYSKGQTYFFTLGYDIVSDKNNSLVDCGATKLVITDKSKFITREPFC